MFNNILTYNSTLSYSINGGQKAGVICAIYNKGSPKAGIINCLYFVQMTGLR